jgi:hypothetical protein
VEEARKLLGVPYELGARLRPNEGVDCQGLVFFALQRLTSTCGWKSWSVMPTRSVAEGELGAPVDGLAPVATARLHLEKLRGGDVIHFVGFDENPAERAIGTLDGRPVWVWHMALATENGRFIVGDHFAGKVVEQSLLTYLAEHAEVYAGIFVTRMGQGPKAAKCRRHPPMVAPAR